MALTIINSPSSRDLGASLPLSPRLYPYYKHPRCKTVQCSRTPLCWTYGPAAGTRINPCVTVLALVSIIWDEEHTSSSLFGSRPPPTIVIETVGSHQPFSWVRYGDVRQRCLPVSAIKMRPGGAGKISIRGIAENVSAGRAVSLFLFLKNLGESRTRRMHRNDGRRAGSLSRSSRQAAA